VKNYNWVAQDDDGCIYLYDKKPEHSDTGKWWRVSIPNSDLSKILRGARIANWKESLIDLSKNDYIIKDGILMATRKHAALIHAWADGAVIQYQNHDGKWSDVVGNDPSWRDDETYRIKPKTKVVRFRNYMYDGEIRVHVQGDAIRDLNPTHWIDEDWREVEIEL